VPTLALTADCWTGTVLFVCKPSVSMGPVLRWHDTSNGASEEVRRLPGRRAGARAVGRRSRRPAAVWQRGLPQVPRSKACWPKRLALLNQTKPRTPAAPKVEANCIDSWCDWNFWRFDVAIPVGIGEKRIDYSVSGQPGQMASFFIAGGCGLLWAVWFGSAGSRSVGAWFAPAAAPLLAAIH
jgi:hypothetical protein